MIRGGGIPRLVVTRRGNIFSSQRFSADVYNEAKCPRPLRRRVRLACSQAAGLSPPRYTLLYYAENPIRCSCWEKMQTLLRRFCYCTRCAANKRAHFLTLLKNSIKKLNNTIDERYHSSYYLTRLINYVKKSGGVNCWINCFIQFMAAGS